MGSQQYDVWIVIAARGEFVFLLTADLYLRLHFVYIYFPFYVFLFLISLSCGAGYTVAISTQIPFSPFIL